MKVQDHAQLCGRLAIANEKASTELTGLLDKWIQKHFVKGSSTKALALLKSFGALSSLITWLRSRSSDADALAIIRKVDPNNKDILSATSEQVIARIEALASGESPLPKPKLPKPAKKAAK